MPDARAIAEELEQRGVRLQLGSSIHDPRDPIGRTFFNMLTTFAEFEADLLSMRTRNGMGRQRPRSLKGKPPKLAAKQQQHLDKASRRR
ncbi:MAG: recombinase family protein [Solirubrobacteraceae bacterium]